MNLAGIQAQGFPIPILPGRSPDKWVRNASKSLRNGDAATAEANATELAAAGGSLLAHVGNTPLLDISTLAHELGVAPAVEVYAKAEWLNPGGSVKSRAALRIIRDAIEQGHLRKGKTIIDSSSGNTGIAYALIGATLGYPVELVMPANVSEERKTLASAYGAKLILSDALEGSDGALRMVHEIVRAEPDRYFYADQYNNPSNWRAHFDTTGPEIWRQTRGRITHFVAGMGTSGTFVGVGRYLRSRKPNVELVALQPEDEVSVIEGLKHMETAIVPGIYDTTLADQYLSVSAEDTWEMTRRLAAQAGLFTGLSAGAATVGSINVARNLESGVVVTVYPDDGSKYLSLGIFN